MRRALLFIFLLAFSLFIFTTVLFIHTRKTTEIVRFFASSHSGLWFTGANGHLLWIGHSTDASHTDTGFSRASLPTNRMAVEDELRFMPHHFEFARISLSRGSPAVGPFDPRTVLAVPILGLIAAFTIISAFTAYRLYRQVPIPGHCPACNYDLRASPDRCPECGRSIPADTSPHPRHA